MTPAALSPAASAGRGFRSSSCHPCLDHQAVRLTAGITSEMMVWWLDNIEGDAPYAGDGQVYSKYLQWCVKRQGVCTAPT